MPLSRIFARCDSPVGSLCLESILRLATIAPATFPQLPLCVSYCLLLASRRVTIIEFWLMFLWNWFSGACYINEFVLIFMDH
jgi:hypothetical protein